MSCKKCELLKSKNEKLQLTIEGLIQKIDIMKTVNKKVVSVIAKAAKVKINK